MQLLRSLEVVGSLGGCHGIDMLAKVFKEEARLF